MPSASISAIEYYFPSGALTNEQFAAEYPEWSAEKIEQKTGICVRHVAEPGQCASDLAFEAAEKLFASGAIDRSAVEYIILSTQNPDYLMPTTACLLQARLGIATTAGAVDVNLACSGFVYSLSLASGLIQSGQVKNVLILTAETYSQILHPQDRAARTIFGDAAAATLVEAVEDPGAANFADSFVFGTDGTGQEHIIVRNGRARHPDVDRNAPPGVDKLGNLQSPNWFYMNGPEVFNFTLRAIPASVKSLLEKSGKSAADVDLFIFHQANRYMLEHLRRKLAIPEDRFLIHMAHCGNTVSSTIPIALRHAAVSGILKPGQVAMLLGFGVGYSWAGAMLHWSGAFRSKS